MRPVSPAFLAGRERRVSVAMLVCLDRRESLATKDATDIRALLVVRDVRDLVGRSDHGVSKVHAVRRENRVTMVLTGSSA